jgi:hypothetical protein
MEAPSTDAIAIIFVKLLMVVSSFKMEQDV